MALGTAGCLITDTPNFDAPRRTRPFLSNLSPSTTTAQQLFLIPVTGEYEERNIYFTVESEDLGQKVRGLVFVDYKGVSKDVQNPPPVYGLEIPAGTLKDTTRRTSFPLSVRATSFSRGCHTVSLVLSHDFSGFSPAEEGDFAIATWFFYFGVDPNEKLDERFICEPDPTPRDAGADARDGGGP